ncbi:MAG: hypothetical protein NZT61_00405 [Deltaproteobacteria bacterium]|nr:hypothetical protein [Deltaproteobacteria bacterium]
MLKKLPLTNFHREKLSAKMGHYAGFEVPIYYESIFDEHVQTRLNCTVCDASHMRVYEFPLSCAEKFLYLTPRKISLKADGTQLSQYTVFLNERGFVVEDGLVFQSMSILLIGNAINAEKLPSYFERFSISFQQREFIILAVQGPQSEATLTRLNFCLPKKRNQMFVNSRASVKIISRTGYTGEDGFELFIDDPKFAETLYLNLIELGVKPCGLGARDTLRIEAGFSLYGNELEDTFSPLESDLEWLIDQNKDFIGKGFLRNDYKLNRFVLREMVGVPRKGMRVFSPAGQHVGFVTSGAKVPFFENPIGFARLYSGFKEEEILIEIRNSYVKADLISKKELKKRLEANKRAFSAS